MKGAITNVGLAIALALASPTWTAFATAAPVLEVFGRPDCDHCARAHAWLEELRSRRPEVAIVEHDVQSDPAARDRLARRAAAAGIAPAVPAFSIGDRLYVGFDTPATTGAALEAALAGSASRAPPDRVHVPLLGEVRLDDLGLPLFTFVVGLLDGFNPCAMWVLLFLLSLLVNLRSRRKMALVGGTFVTIGALAYLAFMAAWLSVFLAIGAARWLEIGLGAIAVAIGSVHLKDGIAPGRGPSLAIPESAKPGIYARVRGIVRAEDLPTALAATAGLAVVVNLIELACTAGLPAIYTQILIGQHLSAPTYYAYLLLYVAAYTLDDAAMLTLAVATLSRRKLQEGAGRILQLASGAVIVLLGLALLFTPGWLAFTGTGS
jgi:hypothetical protein